MQIGRMTLHRVVELAVKEIFETFVPAHSCERIFKPEAKDFFCIRHSVFAAWSLADSKGEAILKEFTHTEMSQWLASVDYCELNKDPRAERQAA